MARYRRTSVGAGAQVEKPKGAGRPVFDYTPRIGQTAYGPRLKPSDDMRLIIAGSRELDPTDDFLSAAIFDWLKEKVGDVKEIVCGCCRGVDLAGERFAKSRGLKVKHFPAEWGRHGRAAGTIRNASMAAYADAAFVVWNGKSRGALDMYRKMQDLNKPAYLLKI